MKVLGIVTVAACLVAVDATAGPVVREAAGVNAAAIQAAVDQFRADLGGPNNGTAAGTQPGGRREITWDGGGAAAAPTLDPSPMTRFSNRGSLFLTPGTGFEISGAPSAEFGELNPSYPSLFAAFSSPRLFAPLGSNVMDVVFHVPGDTSILAGSHGFGAVFTDVDSASSTTLQFFAPDGGLLYERAVPPTTGSETLSFLGVSFNQGEVIGRVRIVSGNSALGPDETGNRDLAVMDDFIFGEPVATAGLTIAPGSGTLFQTASFDLTVGLEAPPAPIVAGRILFDGGDVTPGLIACFRPGALKRGGATFRCQIPRNILPPGEHVLQIELTLANQTRRRNAVRWTVLGNSER